MNPIRRNLLAVSLATTALFAAGAACAADIQERTIKFPSASNKGHPQVLGVEKFAEIVKQKSGGKLTVKPFPGGTLGPDLPTVSAMQGGTVEMTVMNASLRSSVGMEEFGRSFAGRIASLSKTHAMITEDRTQVVHPLFQ